MLLFCAVEMGDLGTAPLAFNMGDYFGLADFLALTGEIGLFFITLVAFGELLATLLEPFTIFKYLYI